ncbi:MAG: glycoside hydrolase family 16 protein [Candidatus Bathyarchaeota archaeon]|nr:glycoside hydrolase family 16 protein [Candidatus Bathyarchaeota archaeon]
MKKRILAAILVLALLILSTGLLSTASAFNFQRFRSFPRSTPTTTPTIPTTPTATPTPTSSPTTPASVTTTTQSSTIYFSGYTWWVENTETPRKPGPNYWSNSPENVWVDENGWLHLQITNRNGKWYCAELTTTQTLGYGTYAFQVASRTDNFDKNVVLGLFAYKDDTHEIDIEFSKWGIADYKNGWFTVQPRPYVEGENQKAFDFQLSGDYTSHYFTWNSRSIYFESAHGHYPVGTAPQANIIQSFTSYKSVSAQEVKGHINLWLYNGNPPSDGNPVEVIIKSFQFISS